MFERMFVDEDTPEQIAEDELRYRLGEVYTDVEAVIETMKAHPNDWVIRTPFALYRYVETAS